jgi:phosphoenolpyruvate carboxylase
MSLHTRDVEQDVRELSTLLGDVLAAQTSPAALETVERVRRVALDTRRDEGTSRELLWSALSGLDADTRDVVARAFTTYFELTNLAEERERVRSIRAGIEEERLDHSLRATVDRLADAGADAETVAHVLDDVLIEPTFTAHPTEARRKTVKAKLRSVAQTVEMLDEHRLTSRERARLERGLESELTTLWQTPQIRDRRPEVTDEVLNIQWYLENILFDVVADVYDELDRALAEHYPEVDVPKLFEFRSWAGSDRDGNPYVTPEVTAETLERQRRVVIAKYRDALDRLGGVLSQDGYNIDVEPALTDRLTAAKERLPGVAAEVDEQHPTEPYRQLLTLMRERVERVGDVRQGGYDSPETLLADLEAVAESLRANGADVVATDDVAPLVRRVDTFGFSLASLDLRDHRANHTETVATVFADVGVAYETMDEDERVAALTDAILQDDPVVDVDAHDEFEGTPARVLRLFASLADWQREYGVDAVDTYCISMTEEPSHVLEVLFLADQAGVADIPGYCGLDVVPLLETESALSGARRIMGTLFENEAYSAALAARKDVQEIMLGYSDSNKENGYLAAQWSLHRNQKRLAAITKEYGVDLRLFHGRGGSISRGGGPMNEALLALPTETVTGQVKFTEQGEAIAENYGNPVIAERNVEQLLDAQIRARYRALTAGDDTASDTRHEPMDVAAAAAREAYRDLLETDGFVRYFEEATPIRVIEDLNLGSRPASRSGERTVEDLRAIPWVFSWTQARCILPGWYGLGTGLRTYLDEGGELETLRTLYEEWPFFQTTLDNAALALARTDLGIAGEYAALAGDAGEPFFDRITAEYERSAGVVLQVTDRERLPPREWIEQNLERRNPYVDPLNLLQIDLLDRDDLTDAERRTLRLTVKGVAAGMKSTG